MTKVTNKHSGMLNVAGVDVRPGATVEVAETTFKQWTNGHAAKIWLKQGIIEADTKVETSDVDDNAATERDRLELRAQELGIDYSPETSDDDLRNAILEAEEAAKDNERARLLQEARDLGLNPNANTGTAKLQKMIADKKAAQ